MRLSLLGLMLLAGIATEAHAYSIDDLLRDARARHSKMISDVGDLRVEQEASFTAKGAGHSGMRAVTYRKGDRWRTDANMTMAGNASMPQGGSLDAISLFDGKDYWSVAMGMKTKLPAGTVPDQSSSPAYWSEPAAGSRVTGDETVAGRACWVIEGPAVPAGLKMMGGPTKTWIDKEHFVLVQSEATLSGKKIRTSFSDFRKVGTHYEIPYLAEVFSDGAKTMTAKIVKLEAGAGLSDDLFDPAKLPGGGGAGAAGAIDIEKLMQQAEEMRKKAEAAAKRN